MHSQHLTDFKLIYPYDIPSKVKKYVTASELNVDKIIRLTWPSSNIINFVSTHSQVCEGKVRVWNLTNDQLGTWGLAGRVIFVIFKGSEEDHSIVKIQSVRQRMHKRASILENLNRSRFRL